MRIKNYVCRMYHSNDSRSSGTLTRYRIDKCGKGVTSFIFYPHVLVKNKKTFRSIPSPLHRGCFFAGSQKAEKVERLHDPILLVVKLLLLVPLQFFSLSNFFSHFPFSSFPTPPPSPLRTQTPTEEFPISLSLSLSLSSPASHLIIFLFDFPNFPLLSYQKRLLERIVCLSPHTLA